MNNLKSVWEKNKEWLTEFEGSALETYYLDINRDNLMHAFKEFKTIAKINNIGLFRETQKIENKWDVIKEYIMSDEIIAGNIVIDYCVDLSDSIFNCRMLIMQQESKIGYFDINLIWWSDESFKNNDKEKVFYKIINHFCLLGKLFKASEFYIGPENPNDPRVDKEAWIKIESMDNY